MSIDNHSDVAPVLIITYTRYDHLRQTVEALRQNYLADQTVLFIASDYPKSEVDRDAVQKVRGYIKSISGFKYVVPIFREYNYGAIQNSSLAKRQIFEEYDRLIVMEDDIVTGRGFLKFVNDGLEKYKSNDDIYAVCGYLWPMKHIVTSGNQIFLHAFCAWGYGMWRDKEVGVQSGPELSMEFLSSLKLFYRMNRASPHYLPMVASIARGQLVAGDVDRSLTLIKCRKLCLFPPKSLVRNIGFDGSGLHCCFDNHFALQPICHEMIDITPLDLVVESEVNRKALYNHFGGNIAFLKAMSLYCAQEILPPFVFSKLWALLKLFCGSVSLGRGDR
jgi:hypothetical protein